VQSEAPSTGARDRKWEWQRRASIPEEPNFIILRLDCGDAPFRLRARTSAAYRRATGMVRRLAMGTPRGKGLPAFH
jgi:hypothetical protein